MGEPGQVRAHSERVGGKRLIAAGGLLALAVLLTWAVVSSSASAHPSEGQPCATCHTQTKSATVTLAATPLKVGPAATVKLSGTVPAGHNWNKVTIQKSRTGSGWKAWKPVTLSGAGYSARWTAPATKGKYYFRTVYLGDNVYKRSVSPAKVVTVK